MSNSICPSCPSGQSGSIVKYGDTLCMSSICLPAFSPRWLGAANISSGVFNNNNCYTRCASTYSSKIPALFELNTQVARAFTIGNSLNQSGGTVLYGQHITLTDVLTGNTLRLDTTLTVKVCCNDNPIEVSYYYIWRSDDKGKDNGLFAVTPTDSSVQINQPLQYGGNFYLQSNLTQPAARKTCNLTRTISTSVSSGITECLAQNDGLCDSVSCLSDISCEGNYMVGGVPFISDACVLPNSTTPIYLPWPGPVNSATSFQFYSVESIQNGYGVPIIYCISSSDPCLLSVCGKPNCSNPGICDNGGFASCSSTTGEAVWTCSSAQPNTPGASSINPFIVILILLGIGIPIIYFLFFRKSKSKTEQETQLAFLQNPPSSSSLPPS